MSTAGTRDAGVCPSLPVHAVPAGIYGLTLRRRDKYDEDSFKAAGIRLELDGLRRLAEVLPGAVQAAFLGDAEGRGLLSQAEAG